MADAPAPPADDSSSRVTELVQQAMQAHLELGESGLQEFCAKLTEHREPVLQRLAKLRRIGLLGSEDPASAPIPERLGEFELLEPLGRGGMGVVYRARQTTLDREVALKLIRPEQAWFPGVRERFRREVETIARLQHDGIVRLYSFGEERGVPWFAMERIRGISLTDVIARLHGRPPRELRGTDLAACLAEPVADGPGAALFDGDWPTVVVGIVERVALALDEAHRQGVLHRDIKPSNVMLTAAGRVVLLDFGLARSRHADRLTRSGAEIGTLHYMAPEQFRSAEAEVDERTDVYALGVVLRELLTLQPTFDGSSIDEVAQRVREGLVTPVRKHEAALPAEVETICLMAMDRDPGRRYPTARRLARDLRNWLEHRPIEAVRPTLGLRLRRLAQRHRAATTVLAILLLVVLAAPAVVALRERGLRQSLEASNRALQAQVERADRNLELATDAIAETLTHFDEQRIIRVPDLKDLVDDVLVRSGRFLDTLLDGNPEDHAARLRLAETLSKAAFVRWEFFDLERTEPMFVRVLQLLDGCAGDVDRLDELELSTRLALVYLRRQRLGAAVAAYEVALGRLRSPGPHLGRPRALRALIGRCLERMALQGTDMTLERRCTLRDQAGAQFAANVAEQPDAAAWLEVARCARAQESEFLAAKDQTRAAQCLATADAAVASAETHAATASFDEIEQLVNVQGLRGRELLAGAQAEAALARFAIAERHCDHLIETRPSRVSGLESWLDIRAQQAAALGQLARHEEQVVVLRDRLARLEGALTVWSHQQNLLRELMAGNRWFVNRGLRAGAITPELRAMVNRNTELAARAESVKGPLASVLDECRRSSTLQARLHLHDGNTTAAEVEVQEAERRAELAAARAKATRVGLPADPESRLVAVEVYCRLGRLEDAVARLRLVQNPPRDALELAPSLRQHADDPRVAAFLQRVAMGR